MKLLLDQNLSHRMIKDLVDEFPGSDQVSLLHMGEASDREIWDFARANDFAIVTLDADFHELSLMLNGPPLIVWLKCGNQPKNVILDKLLRNREAIKGAETNAEVWCVEIY